MQSIIDYWIRCIDFKGVTTKKDFWIPALILMVITVVFPFFEHPDVHGWTLLDILYLILLFPSISLTVRRLHDTNKSGLLWLLNLIPVIGSIIVLFLITGRFNYNNNKWFEADKAHSEYKDGKYEPYLSNHLDESGH